MRFCVPVATLISLSRGITVQGSSVLTYRTVVLPTEDGFDLMRRKLENSEIWNESFDSGTRQSSEPQKKKTEMYWSIKKGKEPHKTTPKDVVPQQADASAWGHGAGIIRWNWCMAAPASQLWSTWVRCASERQRLNLSDTCLFIFTVVKRRKKQNWKKGAWNTLVGALC